MPATWASWVTCVNFLICPAWRPMAYRDFLTDGQAITLASLDRSGNTHRTALFVVFSLLRRAEVNQKNRQTGRQRQRRRNRIQEFACFVTNCRNRSGSRGVRLFGIFHRHERERRRAALPPIFLPNISVSQSVSRSKKNMPSYSFRTI